MEPRPAVSALQCLVSELDRSHACSSHAGIHIYVRIRMSVRGLSKKVCELPACLLVGSVDRYGTYIPTVVRTYFIHTCMRDYAMYESCMMCNSIHPSIRPCMYSSLSTTYYALPRRRAVLFIDLPARRHTTGRLHSAGRLVHSRYCSSQVCGL